MPDAIFATKRLADIYDLLDGERTDLDGYLSLVEECGARSVLDIGCGTGTFACRLAEQGLDVTGVEPAAASLEVARCKRHADRVRWLQGDAATVALPQVEMVTMTANVAQVFLTDAEWSATLRAAHAALRPRGVLAFEVRNPASEAWREWTRECSYRRVEIPNDGAVETWTELAAVRLPFVSFRQTFRFTPDGAVLRSDSTLRFRGRAEIEDSLRAAGFVLRDARDAPDRPGREWVFVAERAEVIG